MKNMARGFLNVQPFPRLAQVGIQRRLLRIVFVNPLHALNDFLARELVSHHLRLLHLPDLRIVEREVGSQVQLQRVLQALEFFVVSGQFRTVFDQ